ncbi:hypothetical protein ACWGNZ_00750 [Sphingomonas zeae]
MNDLQSGSARAWIAAQPAWLRPDDGDHLYGIDAIARYLALPFLDVRTMIEMARLPTWKVGRSHASRRTTLAAHFVAAELAALPVGGPAPLPTDIWPDGAIGLLSGQEEMAAHLGVTSRAISYHRAKSGLGVFWIGKTPFARRASLDRWAAAQNAEDRRTRRREVALAARVAAAPAGAIVGAAAIAAEAGCTVHAAHMAIYKGVLPVQRTGRGIWAHAADVARYADRRHARITKIQEAHHGVS